MDAVAVDGLTVHVKIGELPVTRPNPLPLQRRCGRDRLENKLGVTASVLVRKARRIKLQRQSCCVTEIAHGSIEARKQQQFEHCFFRVLQTQSAPKLVCQSCRFVELVAQSQQKPVLWAPTIVLRRATNQRLKLRLRQPGTCTEERDVHAPLVLALALGSCPVNDKLTLSQCEVATIQ